jgi:hypothetical protein
MRPCQLPSLTHTSGTPRSRITSSLTALALLAAMGLLVTLAAANILPGGSSQEKKEKEPGLYWNPPDLDAPVPVFSTTPPCSLPDVLRQTGKRAAELVDHLQNFIAHERIRYKLTDRSGIPQMSLAAKFDYLVDFGEQSQVPKVHEIRKPLAGTDDGHLSSIVDKGLPLLALIFYPDLQRDYEMRCEGSTQRNNQPAWVIHFRQIKGKPARTSGMEIDSKVYPVSLKGRAWIAAESGQVMHIETNLVDEIPQIDLQVNAISVDYAPVRFQSQNVEIWLPQFAVAYTDFARRRMIIEHTFSDFQLFSVQTQESIQKPKEP